MTKEWALPNKAMILAAGSGTRLRPITESMPKCMVPINGKPVLEHTIQHLRRYGVTELMINLCYLPQVVIDYFGDGQRWGVSIRYSIEEKARGTAGGAKKAQGFFDRTVLVWYGDNLSNCDLGRLFEFHWANHSLATVALYHRKDVTSSGIVGQDEDDRINRFLEKPKPSEVFSHWCNAGIYVLEPAVLAGIPDSGQPDFGHDVFPALLREGERVYGYRFSEGESLWWIDTPADLEWVQRTVQK